MRTHGVAQNNKYGLSRSSGDQESEVKLSAGHVPSDTCGGSFLAFFSPPATLGLLRLCYSTSVSALLVTWRPALVCLSVSVLRIKPCWVRAHPSDCMLMGSQLNRPNFQIRTGSQVLDVRTSTDHCGGHDSTRNRPEAFCHV